MSFNIGSIFNEKRIYKLNADLFFTAFDKAKYFDSKTIIHFYLWDTHFKKIENEQGFVELLTTAKNKGVKYICQSDFSCWFFNDRQRRENIIKNFQYHDLINLHGFNQLLNFNTIFQDHYEFYKTKLDKSYFGLVMDLNHSEDGYINYEIENFKMLLSLCKFDNLIFLTGKKNESIKNRYEAIINLAMLNKIKITVLPTEMVILRLKKQRFYK